MILDIINIGYKTLFTFGYLSSRLEPINLDNIYLYKYYRCRFDQSWSNQFTNLINNYSQEVKVIYQLIDSLDKNIGVEEAKAHCDVPCGIYDPIVAQINALTVVRMMDLMADLDGGSGTDKAAYHNSMSRYIAVKEEHAEKAKHEIRVIWGDYIKSQHIEQFPEFPTLTHNIMALGSKCRQTVDRGAAVDFVEAINKFAEFFWQTKGVATKRANAPYAPALELVYPDL
jgi:nickel superoxide dismutase